MVAGYPVKAALGVCEGAGPKQQGVGRVVCDGLVPGGGVER